MNKKEWNEGANYIDSEIVENYIRQKEKLAHEKKTKAIWLRFGALAVCFALIFGAIAVVPMLRDDRAGIIPSPGNNKTGVPVGNVQSPSSAPIYYGSESSNKGSGVQAERNTTGLSVTARFIDALPDTYTFFDDWGQREFRIVRMKTLKLLFGGKMTEDFYFIIPVDYMVDFSKYDRFVIKDMAQYGYDYSVVYNKTQGKAEQLDLVLFGYSVLGFSSMGCGFMAFNSFGFFDKRLWNANDAWRNSTKGSFEYAPYTIVQAERNIRKNWNEYKDAYGGWLRVHLLNDISGGAAEVLSQIKNFENGLYVPDSDGSKLNISSDVQFRATRYIGGFATNEKVKIWGKGWDDTNEYTYELTKAHFEENDLNKLPDLSSAISAVAYAFNKGEITPTHIVNHEELGPLFYGIFGWYAKTAQGVIGVVRVNWHYLSNELDDAYYIIEYNSNECRPIDRDDLLEMIGEYETSYIYDGEYNEKGKLCVWAYA